MTQKQGERMNHLTKYTYVYVVHHLYKHTHVFFIPFCVHSASMDAFNSLIH